MVDDVEIDSPGFGEVLVAVAHCGVCHSDLHIVDGSLPSPLPVVLGHEAAGVVAEVGPGVDHLAVGQPVLLSPRPPCGRCYMCQRGNHTQCLETAGLMLGTFADGSTRLRQSGRTVYRGIGLGAFAEQVVIPATGAIPLPDDIPLETACVLGCAVQTGVGAVLNTARVEPGATVLVMGLGGIGASIVMGAVLAPASQIIGVDPLPDRRRRAEGLGATHTLDPTSDEIGGAVLNLTDGVGVDYAFDAVGRAALVETCVQSTRAAGTTVMVGVPPLSEQVAVPGLMFAVSEKKLLGCFLGSCHSPRDIPRFVALWRAGRLPLEQLISTRRPLADINAAFADLASGAGLRTVIST